MPRTPQPVQALQHLASTHLSPAALVQYHDDTINDATLRLHLELHLELCSFCQQQLAAVSLLHPSEEELMDYHDQQVHNARTLARLQAHLETHHCQSCLAWIEDLHQATALAATWTPQAGPAEVQSLVAAASSVAPPQTLGERLAALRQRLGTLLPLRIPAGFGQRLAPQYATPQMAIDGEPLPGLHVLAQPLDAGGQVLTLSSELEQYAGQLYRFVYRAPDSEEPLLHGFTVLPMAPDDAFCYESRVQIPAEALASWTTEGVLDIYLVAVEEVQADDLPVLEWSLQQTVETISRDAWRVWCQRLQHQRALPETLRDWCARQLAILTPHD